MNDRLSDYVDVAERVQAFYAKYPEGSLQPLDVYEPYKLIEVAGQTYLVYAAAAYRDPHDPRPGVGMAWELVPGKTAFTNSSELMVAETSAWGRAIAALGFATKKLASRQEVMAAESRRTVERIQAPVEDDPWATPLTEPISHDAPTCAHGERIKKTGKNARGPWVGWYCPQPREAADRCQPIFGDKA